MGQSQGWGFKEDPQVHRAVKAAGRQGKEPIDAYLEKFRQYISICISPFSQRTSHDVLEAILHPFYSEFTVTGICTISIKLTLQYG